MIYFLSAVGVARTLLYIVAIYFIVKILSRLLAPILLRYAVNKVEKKFNSHFNQHQNTNAKKQPEGKSTIEKMPTNKTSSNKNVGEYIDYEEID